MFCMEAFLSFYKNFNYGLIRFQKAEMQAVFLRPDPKADAALNQVDCLILKGKAANLCPLNPSKFFFLLDFYQTGYKVKIPSS